MFRVSLVLPSNPVYPSVPRSITKSDSGSEDLQQVSTNTQKRPASCSQPTFVQGSSTNGYSSSGQ